MTDEVQPIYWLEVPDGRFVLLRDLPHLLADVLWPDEGDQDERIEYGLARLNFEESLKRDAVAGTLKVWNPLTSERFPSNRPIPLDKVTVSPFHDLAPWLKASNSLIGVRLPPPPGFKNADDGQKAMNARSASRARLHSTQKDDAAKTMSVTRLTKPQMLTPPSMSSTLPSEKQASSTKILAVAVEEIETKEQRQARRYEMCLDAGLVMPDNDYAGLPRGISKLAAREGITRQAFTEDVKAHIRRIFNPGK